MYCIYRITNLVNRKTYIGQHRYEKLNDDYMRSGKLLKQAQKKYGIESFKKEILVFNVLKKEHIDLLEKIFIASEREKVGIENCYNMADGGQGFSGCLSEETKKKISLAHRGKHHSEEWIRKIAEANKGRKRSEEARKHMSEVKKGKPKSEVWKRSHSNRMKGRLISEETRRKKSKAFKGKHWKLVDGKRVWY